MTITRYPRQVGTPRIEYVERKFQLNKTALSKRAGIIYTLNKVGLFLDTHHLTYLRDVLPYLIMKKRLLLYFSSHSRYIAPEIEPVERIFNSESLTLEFATQSRAIYKLITHIGISSILLSTLAPYSRRDNRGGVQPSWLLPEKSYFTHLWLETHHSLMVSFIIYFFVSV